MKNYNCPKGMVKWTHRAMMLSFLFLIIGIILIIVSAYRPVLTTKDIEESATMLNIGIVFIVIYVLMMLLSSVNAFIRGCYLTAVGAFLLS